MKSFVAILLLASSAYVASGLSYYSCIDGDDHCYYLDFNDKEGKDSIVFLEKCGSKGGQLAKVLDQAEQTRVETFLWEARNSTSFYRSFDKGILIDGTDAGHEGQWTVDGVDITLDNWLEGEPDNYAKFRLYSTGDPENCIILDPKNNFQWKDYSCYAHMLYLCKVAKNDELGENNGAGKSGKTDDGGSSGSDDGSSDDSGGKNTSGGKKG